MIFSRVSSSLGNSSEKSSRCERRVLYDPRTGSLQETFCILQQVAMLSRGSQIYLPYADDWTMQYHLMTGTSGNGEDLKNR